MLRYIAVATLLLLVGAPRLLAADDQSPEAVAKAAMDSMREGKIAEFAGLMHPDALQALKDMLLPVIDAAARDNDRDLQKLFGDKDYEQIKAMTPREFFITFMRSVLNLRPEVQEILKNSKWEFLGHVKEGDDTVHIVVRYKADYLGASITKLEVLSARRHEGAWRLLLTGDVQNMASALKQRYKGGKL